MATNHETAPEEEVVGTDPEDPMPKVIPETETAISKPPLPLSYTEKADMVMVNTGDDQLSQQSCEDPLFDPLAIDDIVPATDVAPLEPGSLDLIDTRCLVSVVETTATDAEIILVDMNRLKNSSPVDSSNVCEDENQFDQCLPPETAAEAEEGVRSDGSDSGLGSEPSNNNATSVPVRPPVCK